MALKPVIKTDFDDKKCVGCGRGLSSNKYLKTKSFLYPDGHLDMCNDCVNDILEEENYSWDIVDRLCQYLDIPFVPEKWEDLLVRLTCVRMKISILYSPYYSGIANTG